MDDSPYRKYIDNLQWIWAKIVRLSCKLHVYEFVQYSKFPNFANEHTPVPPLKCTQTSKQSLKGHGRHAIQRLNGVDYQA